jgi:methylated-DNA-[protein]-cysteine S-methyltransferase
MKRHIEFDSPLGPLRVIAGSAGLCAVSFAGQKYEVGADGSSTAADRDELLAAARTQLNEYFAGRRHEFDLPLAPEGSDFQQSVWRALLGVEFGRTASYGALAAQVGRPDAARAVGAAVGRNPIAIIIPCHRIIGADGSLTGYAGGLPRKTRLLEIEGVLVPLSEHDSAQQSAQDA